uniref:Uncharacterized protein n=1 Tax=viral metagenome TaxID=1070528 RepID=A0A6M3LPV5_9ZZZZ
MGIANCVHCGTGKNWWLGNFIIGYKCPSCDGNPLNPNSKHLDERQQRAKFVQHFGCRIIGDEELLDIDMSPH